MEKLLDWIDGIVSYVRYGNMSQIVLTINEDMYEMGMNMKRSLHEEVGEDVSVRLIVGEKLTLDDDVEIELKTGEIVMSLIYDGHLLSSPRMMTSIMHLDTEE